MATTYENVPVFRNSLDYQMENLVGKATVEIGDDGKTTIVTIEAGENFTRWLQYGNLQALALGAAMNQVDSEKMAEYWAEQRR